MKNGMSVHSSYVLSPKYTTNFDYIYNKYELGSQEITFLNSTYIK